MISGAPMFIGPPGSMAGAMLRRRAFDPAACADGVGRRRGQSSVCRRSRDSAARAAVAWAWSSTGRTSRSKDAASRPAGRTRRTRRRPRRRARRARARPRRSTRSGARRDPSRRCRWPVGPRSARRPRVGGHLRGQAGRLVDQRRPSEGGHQLPRPGEVGGAHGHGQATGRIDRRDGVHRVVVGDPARRAGPAAGGRRARWARGW